MTGAVVVKLNAELEVKDDIPVPEPAGSEFLIKISANSLCNSDLAGIAGYTGSNPPYVPGHEPVGRIVKLGPATPSSFKIGDRVGFMPGSRVCSSCRSCLLGNHRFCKSRTNFGFSALFGGFSEYSLVDPMSAVKIPDALTDEEAAPLLCAGVTAYGAVKKVAQYQAPGTLVNVVGCGGVGHLVIQYADKMGFDVQAFDVAEDKLELARKCGTKFALDSSKPDAAEAAEKAVCTIVVSGVSAAYDFAFKVTSHHGKVIAIGVPHSPTPVNILDLVLRDISLIATNQGTKEELFACLQLAAARDIRPVYEKHHIGTINEGIADMKAGKVVGRYVYNF
jgi:propanol-preferring alcohol dehydrogenase